MVACGQGACRGGIGGCTSGVRTNQEVHKGEIVMNSREFTLMNPLQACLFFGTSGFGRHLGMVDAFGTGAGLLLDDA